MYANGLRLLVFGDLLTACRRVKKYFLDTLAGRLPARQRQILLFPEHQQLAGRVIGNDHEYRDCQLHKISIPAEDVHQQPHQPRLRRAGADPAAHKFDKLRDHRPCGPVMAPEHEGLVGHIGKQHRQRPGGGIAPGTGKPRPVVKGEIHRVIDQRGQHAEEKIGNQLPVFFQKRLQFSQSLPSFPPWPRGSPAASAGIIASIRPNGKQRIL